MNSIKVKSVSWAWQAALGALLILCGAVALATPIATSVTLAWLLGGLILASGLIQFVHALRFTQYPGSASRFSLSALSILVGLLMIRNPMGGMVGITLILGFFLLMGGILKTAVALELRPHKGWGWVFFSALSSLILGTWLVATFPTTSLVAPGIFFGIDMIFFGSALIGAAMVHKDLLHVQTMERAA